MRKKQLNTGWRVWLDGKNESEAQKYHIVDGLLTVLLEGVTQVGGVVDRRGRSVLVEPKSLEDNLLKVLIDGKLHLMYPGRIHDLHMKYTTRGPCGEATLDATWHLRLVSVSKD